MDAGFKDADGYVFVMSRSDDVINVAGHRLSTGAIEEVRCSKAIGYVRLLKVTSLQFTVFCLLVVLFVVFDQAIMTGDIFTIVVFLHL